MLLSDWPKLPTFSLISIYIVGRNLQARRSYAYASAMLTKPSLRQQYIANVLTCQEIWMTRPVFDPLTLAATDIGEAKE